MESHSNLFVSALKACCQRQHSQARPPPPPKKNNGEHMQHTAVATCVVVDSNYSKWASVPRQGGVIWCYNDVFWGTRVKCRRSAPTDVQEGRALSVDAFWRHVGFVKNRHSYCVVCWCVSVCVCVRGGVQTTQTSSKWPLSSILRRSVPFSIVDSFVLLFTEPHC